MKIYTDYLKENSEYYNAEGIELDLLFSDNNAADSSKMKYYVSTLPKSVTVRLINNKYQLVPSGEVDVKSSNFIFKPKAQLNKVHLELDVYPITYGKDSRWMFNIDVVITKLDGSISKYNIIGKDDIIIHKDLRSYLYYNDLTEWDYVYVVTLNIHDYLAIDGQLGYNEAEYLLTEWIGQLLTVIQWNINKDEVKEREIDTFISEFPESLDKLEEDTKEQLKMIINKGRAQGLGIVLDLTSEGQTLLNNDNDDACSLIITRGNLKFIDKSHVTNIEFDPEDDNLASDIYQFVAENLVDTDGAAGTIPTLEKDLVDYNSGATLKELIDMDEVEVFYKYTECMNRMEFHPSEYIMRAVDVLKVYIADPSVLVGMKDENTIVVEVPETKEVKWSCEFKRLNNIDLYEFNKSNSTECIRLTEKNKVAVLNYMYSLIYK